MNQMLTSQVAFLMSAQILESVQTYLPEEEQRDAFEEFFTICKRELECYEVQVERQHKRLGRSESPFSR
jgi:hypothetical protein